MIGLDTNIVLRDLLQDDPKQTRQENQVIDRRLSDENPGFVSLGAAKSFKRTPVQIAAHLAQPLAADTLSVQNEQQVFEAVFALKRGTGEFEDALIGALDLWSGCSVTLTVDRKAARLPHFRPIP